MPRGPDGFCGFEVDMGQGTRLALLPMKSSLSLLKQLFSTTIFLAIMSTAQSQHSPDGFNYDEDKVPEYTLPDPLLLENGNRVEDARTWSDQRRPETLELFRKHVYGRSPAAPESMRFEVRSEDPEALEGKATRREITVRFAEDRDDPSMDILVYIPNDADGPVPAFLGLNFFGNHTIHADPGITLSTRWMRSRSAMGVVDNRATEDSRGVRSDRWQVEKVIARGYAVATIYCGDLVPDRDDGLEAESSITAYFREKRNQEGREPEDWGAIGAWAWGLSRAVDYFETDDQIDAERISVLGHSRLGKTSLWAGAQDERFAIVISNNSGCGGAAVSRRRFGETVKRINTNFPHWFCLNFRNYNDDEDALPVDQHQLIALAAPRPAYVASATKDLWADPRGEFLAARHAGPVYELFGKEGLGVEKMPEPDTPVGDTIGYHVREGGHSITAYDWSRYLDFADRHLR